MISHGRGRDADLPPEIRLRFITKAQRAEQKRGRWKVRLVRIFPFILDDFPLKTSIFCIFRWYLLIYKFYNAIIEQFKWYFPLTLSQANSQLSYGARSHLVWVAWDDDPQLHTRCSEEQVYGILGTMLLITFGISTPFIFATEAGRRKSGMGLNRC